MRIDISLTAWGDIDILASYSITYAFGAYLARNFDGVELFKYIVRTDELGTDAVTTALSAKGYSETFEIAMTKWAAANLFSDDAGAQTGYRYNRGGYFSSSLNGMTYNLGSINLYNYYYSEENQEGPFIYTTSPVGDWGAHLGTSNLYYRVGSDLTGTITRSVTFGSNVLLTIVVKDD